MTNPIYEIDFLGGPFDGHRTRDEWIPICGLQMPVVGDSGKLACYEWSAYRVEMVNGVPQIHHQLKFCGIRAASRNSAWRLIRRIGGWVSGSGRLEGAAQTINPVLPRTERDAPRV